MITDADLELLRGTVAGLQEQALAFEQTLAIQQANITLALDKNASTKTEIDQVIKTSKEAIADARAVILRLTDLDRVNRQVVAEHKANGLKLGALEEVSKETVHRLASLRSAIGATMDYLDRVEPTTTLDPSKGTA